jgi:hypothetical protein
MAPASARADASVGEPSARVSLELGGCDAAFAGEVRRIAGIELRTPVDPPDSPEVVTRAVVRAAAAGSTPG